MQRVKQFIHYKLLGHDRYEWLWCRAAEVRRPAFRSLARNLEGMTPLTLYVVGARGGVEPVYQYLSRAGLMATVGFEPDPVEAHALEKAGSFTKVYPVALGSREEERTLHITANIGCTSLLEPDIDALLEVGIDPDWWRVERRAVVRTVPLDSLVVAGEDPAPDILQIDTQGFDLEVLRGASETLLRTACVETEQVFYREYNDQPDIMKVVEFMLSRRHVLYHIERNSENLAFNEVNAYFFNDEMYRNPATRPRVEAAMAALRLKYRPAGKSRRPYFIANPTA
jgi:FkbM family methyltransferase